MASVNYVYSIGAETEICRTALISLFRIGQVYDFLKAHKVLNTADQISSYVAKIKFIWSNHMVHYLGNKQNSFLKKFQKQDGHYTSRDK